MTGQRRDLTDSLIAAAIMRRAPGHPDARLLTDILAASAATPQLRAPLRELTGRSVRLSRTLLMAAALAGLGLLLAVAVGSRLHTAVPSPGPSTSAVEPSSSPTESAPAPSPSDVVSGGCTPAHAVTPGASIGEAAAPAVTIPDGVLDLAAFTAPAGASAANGTDVWAVDASGRQLLARVVPPSTVAVADASADGARVVLDVRTAVSASTCHDLFLVDRSTGAIRQLTDNRLDEVDSGAALSADGRYLAAGFGGLNDEPQSLDFWDLETDAPSRRLPCLFSPAGVGWTPSGHRYAAVCGTTLEVIDPTLPEPASIAIPFDFVKWPVLAWTDRSTVLFANEASPALGSFEWRTIVLAEGDGPRFDGSFSEPVMAPINTIPGQDLAVSPDGRRFTTWSYASPCCLDGDLVDTATGQVTAFAQDVTSTNEVAWSTNGQSLLYVETAVPPDALDQIVIVSLGGAELGRYDLPEGVSGIWRLP